MSPRSVFRVVCAVAVGAAMLLGTSRTALADLPQPGDIAFGVNLSSAANTLELLRGSAVMSGGTKLASPWTTTPFLQSVRFDNTGGVSHNVHGNLLAIDFGNATNGGQIFSLPTTGAEPLPGGQLIGNTRPAPDNVGQSGGVSLTRLGGLSVSPDNTKIAVTGYDTGTVIVYDYTAGDTMGAGAALSNGRETASGTLVTGGTQGSVWLDNDTVLTMSAFGSLFEVDANNMAITNVASVTTPFVGSNYSGITYNPDVSPYIYADYSGFDGSATTNKLYVFDPANSYSVVKEIDLSTSSQTARDLALDKDGNLFISGFGGTIDFIPAANVLNPTTLTDNSSIDWYDSQTSGSLSFNSIDIGFGTQTSFAAGDFNESGTVDAADLMAWKAGFGMATGATHGKGDADGDNDVDGADFLVWQQQMGMSSAVAAASAVPEPAALLLVLAGSALIAGGRRGK